MSGALLPSFSLFCPAIAQPLAEMLMQLVPMDVISQGDRRPLTPLPWNCDPAHPIKAQETQPRRRRLQSRSTGSLQRSRDDKSDETNFSDLRREILGTFGGPDGSGKRDEAESGTVPISLNWAVPPTFGERKAGKRDRSAIGKRQVRYWQYGQAEKSPDLAISDLSRFLSRPISDLSRFPRFLSPLPRPRFLVPVPLPPRIPRILTASGLPSPNSEPRPVSPRVTNDISAGFSVRPSRRNGHFTFDTGWSG